MLGAAKAVRGPRAGGQAVPFPPAAAPASPCPRVGLAASFSSPPLPRAGLSLGEESGGHSPSGPDRGEGAGNVPPLREKGLRERAEGLSPNYFIKLCCMHLFGSPCRKDTCAFNGCSHRHNYRQWKETEKHERGGDVRQHPMVGPEGNAGHLTAPGERSWR